jgi:hypothetical protein
LVFDGNWSRDMKECAIGIRVHSGWGALVAVAGEPGAIDVVERRRIEIIDRNAAGAAQPYHFAKELELAEAKKFIASSASASSQMALTAMREIVDRLRSKAYNIVAAAILLSSGRHLPELEKILSSHPMIHTAEGEFFRHAFRDACMRLKIPVSGIRERELDERTKSVLGKDAGSLKKKIAGLGKTLGPPWTSDQKTATLAAVIALAERDS